MKKLSVLLLSALLIVVSFAFTSCDQQAVDDALNNLMETSVDIFEAVFKKADVHIDEDGEKENAELGNAVGNACYGYEMEVFDENGKTGTTFDPADNKGKITVINFWGTWCGGCIEELPYFDTIATEYKDTVTVVAVHTHRDFDTASEYIDTHYKDSNIIFVKDVPLDEDDVYSDEAYFKMLGGGDSYPITIILDEHGVIIASIKASTNYTTLKEIIDTQLANNE